MTPLELYSMVIVVSKIHVSGSCPRFLQPVGVEMRKSLYHAFESEEELHRYCNSLEHWVKELNEGRNSYLGFSHAESESGGEITIFRRRSYSDLLRMDYFILRDHVMVGKDGRHIYPQEFLKEGGSYV